MQSRISWWWWLVLALLLLAPGPAGRLLLDVVGGITLLVVLLPVLLGGLGWLAWVLLQQRLKTCPACGFRSLGADVCPACGTLWVDPAAADSGTGRTSAGPEPMFDARDVTIDIQAKDVDAD
jgi:hypothetical protein